MTAGDEFPESAPLEMSAVFLPSGTAVIRLRGDLDIASAQAATGYVTDVIDHHRGPVVLDVAAVDYCDSHGLSALLRMSQYAQRANRPFRLASPNQSLVKKMRITGMDSRFLLSHHG